VTRGLLFSQMDPPPGREADFHDWYDTEHIPARLALAGFEAAARYRAVTGQPRYLAVYELSDLAALGTPGYRRLKDEPSARTRWMLSHVRGFTRFTCELLTDVGSGGVGEYLSAVAFAVPGEDTGDLAAWYDTEHVPALLAAPGWLRVRRWQVRSGSGAPWTHLALHELASRSVMDSPQRAAARRGPLRDALASRPWFSRSGRWLYELLGRWP